MFVGLKDYNYPSMMISGLSLFDGPKVLLFTLLSCCCLVTLVAVMQPMACDH